MRAPSYYLNGVSLAGLGFMPAPADAGRRSGLSYSRPQLELPGVAGRMGTGALSVASRTLTIPGEVLAADRDAVLAAVRTIMAHAGRGSVELRCVDALDRVINVTRDGSADFAVDTPSMLSAQRSGRLTLRFLAEDPCWRDRDLTERAIAQAAVACPIGESLPSPWTLQILGSPDGSVLNPQVIYADAEGTTITTLTLTGSLTSWATDPTSMWELSTEGLVPRIRKRALGVWADDDAALTTGAFFALSPLDGWPAGGAYPSVRLFDASARATGLLSWRKRHEL
ncbi:MAG: phage tail family protein [Gemmatimonadaceae bacterium]